MPCSLAILPAVSAACCAANGVDFLEPLKPKLPALDQDTVLTGSNGSLFESTNTLKASFAF